MKRTLIILLAGTLLFCLYACGSPTAVPSPSPSPEPAAIYTAGAYEAVGKGKGGEVPVTVVFSEFAIESVSIGENKETEGIGTLAAEELPDKIIEAQSADINGVSGATITSDAILTAVRDCIEQAAK